MGKMIISVFYDIDSFCKELKKFFEDYLIAADGEAASFEPPSGISLIETMAVCVFFHLSGYRFVELMPYAAMPMGRFPFGQSA